jgi:hypothetical protein
MESFVVRVFGENLTIVCAVAVRRMRRRSGFNRRIACVNTLWAELIRGGGEIKPLSNRERPMADFHPLPEPQNWRKLLPINKMEPMAGIEPATDGLRIVGSPVIPAMTSWNRN